MNEPDEFTKGIDLFNAQRYFECHEVWEELWKRASGAEKLFYQGLIQAAVAILHAQRGNQEGARTLYAKARAKLDPIADEHRGIAIGEFRDALARFFAIALKNEASALPQPPKIRRAIS